MQQNIPLYVPLLPPDPPKVPEEPGPLVPDSVQGRINYMVSYMKILGEENAYRYLGWVPTQIDTYIKGKESYETVKSMIEGSLQKKRQDDRYKRYKDWQSKKKEKGGKEQEQKIHFELLIESGLIEKLLLDEKGWRAYNVATGLIEAIGIQERFDEIKDKEITNTIKSRAKEFTLDNLYLECLKLAEKKFTKESAASCIWNYLFANDQLNLCGYDIQFLKEVKEKTEKYKQDCVNLAAELNTKISGAEQEAEAIKTKAKNESNKDAEAVKKQANEDANTIKAQANKDAEAIKEQANKDADAIKDKANRDAGDIIPNAKKSVKDAYRLMRLAYGVAAIVLMIAVPGSLFCLFQASYATVSATAANTRLAEYEQTFDTRLAAAIDTETAVLTEATQKTEEREQNVRWKMFRGKNAKILLPNSME